MTMKKQINLDKLNTAKISNYKVKIDWNEVAKAEYWARIDEIIRERSKLK